MKLGSLFDGIGGWQIAAKRAGIKPVWSSEIERFPCAVTAKHFPDTKQLGDVTKLDGAKLDPVDIICAGSPCQDLSTAGKREGLKGERSGLFLRAVELVRDMRRATSGRWPRFFVWENVTGAFSSNRGMDFRAVLQSFTSSTVPVPFFRQWAPAGMVRSKDCDVAWRVLDAQYWGVPQRRKRIFLVADFTGRCAGEILFERESLSRNIEAGEEAGEGASVGVGNGGYIPSKARALTARADGSPCVDRGPNIIAVYDMTHADEVMRPVPGGKCPTLNARMGTGGNQIPVIHSYTKNTIRRLTPLECERLQGLPDNYTLIDDKSCSDTARYKALGNGMAQPCADWIIRRIAEISLQGENNILYGGGYYEPVYFHRNTDDTAGRIR